VSLVYASNALTVSNLRLDVGLVNLSGSSRWQGRPGPQRRCLDLSVGRRTSPTRAAAGFWVPASTACRFRTWLEISTGPGCRLFRPGAQAEQQGGPGYGRHKDAGDATILFAPARAIASLNLGLNELFLRQTCSGKTSVSTTCVREAGSTAFYSTLSVAVPCRWVSAIRRQ